MVNEDKDLDFCAQNLSGGHICPILKISCVTGMNMDKLVRFIHQLKNRGLENQQLGSIDDPVHFDIHEKFSVTGSGLVFSGTVASGTVKLGMTLLCGPDKFKQFKSVVVKGIHVNRVHKEYCYAGNFATLNVKAANKKDELSKRDFRKGMCLLDPKLKPVSTWEFEAEVVILHHSTTIKHGYQAVVHCGVIRQAVSIESINKELLRTGDKGLIRFRFLYSPEYIKPESTILLREGRTKILGRVTTVFTDAENNK